ncbi:MAG: hypothetical protein WC117_00245 [Sphaerochaetaceae bacterium]|jgi:hypothetical protein
MEIINEQKVAEYPYIAGFKGTEVGLYAPSLAAAKQRAIEYFRPKKRDAGMVWVELA